MPGTRTLLLGIAVLLVILIALVAVLLVRQSQQVAQAPAQQAQTTEATAPAKEGTTPVSTSGRGSDTLTITYKRPALITYVYTYKDEGSVPGHFSLSLPDPQGKQLDLIVNVVGSTQGSKAVRIPRAGEYTINVKADKGSWTLESRG